jgi:hypothetical protein
MKDFCMSKVIEVEKHFSKLYKGKSLFAIVILQVALESIDVKVEVNCSGDGWIAQGYFEEATALGYEDWKQGAMVGVEYALRQANCLDCTVVVTKIVGMFTDTNPSIVAVAAAMAVWQALNYKPTEPEEKKLEDIVFNSWNLPYDAIPEI